MLLARTLEYESIQCISQDVRPSPALACSSAANFKEKKDDKFNNFTTRNHYFIIYLFSSLQLSELWN